MKQCPTCQRVFSPEDVFCPNDGATLTAQSASDAGRVVISWDDQSRNEIPTQVVQTPQPITVSGTPAWLYALTGALAAVILMGAGYFLLVGSREKDPEKARIENSNISTKSNPANASHGGNNATGGERGPAAANSGVDPIDANQSGKNDKANAERYKETSKTDENLQGKLPRKGYNGRVIMMNAIVRSSPSIYAPEIYLVSFDEPIKIGKSAGGNNPWFRVTTTGGMTGWMHGNTIEFVR